MRTRLEFFDTMYFGAVLAGAEEWAATRGTSNELVARDAEFITSLKPKILLDVGCGRGELMAQVANLGHGLIRCVGVDPATISAAYRRCTFNEFQVEELCLATDSDASVSDRPYGQPGYDVVVARNLFECLDPDAVPRAQNAEVKRTLDKMRGWLRPGGRVLLRTPWGQRPWDRITYEKMYSRWLAMGHARNLAPWKGVDVEGRMTLNAEVPGASSWMGLTAPAALYTTLTIANPWEGTPDELAIKFFPGMQFYYDASSDWLILQEP